ncbi:protein translocase subunit SecF [Candidatus Dependentiae bacterium]|nr:protein translocase subunit SecF [Candidatus Dependentiae bacterium]
MINFLKYRYFCFALSVAFLLVGLIAYFIKGGFTYHIDFSGGAELRISFENKIDISKVRKAMSEKGWKNFVIQSIGNQGKEFIVRVGSKSLEGLENKFKKDIDSATPGNKMTIKNIDWVGAEVGSDMQKNAIFAVLLSLLVILLYISIRSKYAYAIGAVVAIAHDILAVLVFLLLVGEPISLSVVAALLAILGYSLNDTIVIFSRIKENLIKMRGDSIYQIANVSLNQTFTRTIRTSISTLLAVGSFYIFGGETLRGFALAMIAGTIIGTYSSIYIASPVMLSIISFKNLK